MTQFVLDAAILVLADRMDIGLLYGDVIWMGWQYVVYLLGTCFVYVPAPYVI